MPMLMMHAPVKKASSLLRPEESSKGRRYRLTGRLTPSTAT